METPDYADEVLDYDGEIQNEGTEFTVLPNGDEATFKVVEVEKGRSKDGTKPQVRVRMALESVNGHGRTTLNDYITMTRKSEWKLCEFFTSLGLRRHGERLKMRWDIVGMTGRCTVIVEEFTGREGEKKQTNRIKKYLEPADNDGQGADADFA